MRWAPVALAAAALACGGVATGGPGESHEQAPSESAAHGTRKAAPSGATTMLGQGGTSSFSDVTQNGGSAAGGFAGPVTTSGGAAGSMGSDGGPPGDDADCSSPVTKELAPFVARASEDLGVSDQLAQASQAILGSWHGFVKTPWTEPYQIVASFNWEGGYSARCEQNSDFGTANAGCCRAFYYGSDRNSPFKSWRLTSVNADHTVEGNIDIMFCDGEDNCRPPAWQGKLRMLDYDQTGQRIRFQFWRDDGYGPLQVELERD